MSKLLDRLSKYKELSENVKNELQKKRKFYLKKVEVIDKLLKKPTKKEKEVS